MQIISTTVYIISSTNQYHFSFHLSYRVTVTKNVIFSDHFDENYFSAL